MAGLTFSIVTRNVSQTTRSAIVDITFDASYPTGGESFNVDHIDPGHGAVAFRNVECGSTVVPALNEFHYDYTNKKLLAFVMSSGVEVADTTDLADNVVRAKVEWGVI